MAEDRSKTSTGPNDPPPVEAQAGTTARQSRRKRGLEADKKTLAAGVAMGIGSAAIVAALLYATRPKRKDR